ncbi:MAG: histidine phosphatase family protein [Acidimicrobiia bacterium]|nr:histidine phosphatase family protein [Acidimicrobiia bacterium]
MTDTPTTYPQRRYAPPPGACDLLLVRHGASAPFEPGTRFPLRDGHGDPPLAPEGHLQAERLAGRLHRAGISAIYVTSLCRTHQTAAPLAARVGIEPVEEPDLREVHLGEWEGGVFRQRLAEGDPLSRRIFTEQRWDVIPGAESTEALEQRVLGALQRIADQHVDERVVVVTHGGVIGTVVAATTGATGFAFVGADNASITRVVVHGEQWAVRSFNDTVHLDEDHWLA